jgi:hypothetical protein
MTDGCSMNVDVVTCAALTGQSEPPGKAALSARRPSRAARTPHLPTKPARMGCIGCNRVLENEPDSFSTDMNIVGGGQAFLGAGGQRYH